MESQRPPIYPKKTTLFEGKYKRFVSKDGWEYIERVNCCGIVSIMPVTDDGKIVFVEQLRVPIGKRVIEFPAGLAEGANTEKREELLQDAARRELIEETGYDAEELICYGEGPISSSSSDDIIVLYFARGLKKVGSGGGDATESIVVHLVNIAEVDQWLDQKKKEGLLVDPKVFGGLYYLKHKIHNAIRKSDDG